MKISKHFIKERVRCIETGDQNEESLMNEFLDDKGRST